MKSVGQILKQTREQKKIDLVTVEQVTKIQKKFLMALEKDEFDLLPSKATTRGFIKNYAEYLSLSSESLLAVFRRDDFPQKIKSETAYQRIFTDWSQGWWHRPRLIVGLTVILILAGYLFRSYWWWVRLPTLIVETVPTETNEQTMMLRGRSDPDTTIWVNNIPVIVDERGVFQSEITLFTGENQVTVKAVSRRGRETRWEKMVFHLDK